MFTMSMYRQLWLAVIISMMLALGGALLASLLSASSYLESQLSVKNTDNATALALSLSLSQPDPAMVELTVASLFDGGHYEWIRVADPAGKILIERTAPLRGTDAPEWFVRIFPLHAEPGRAQISSGWKQVGVVTLASHSRYAYGALWKSAYEMVMALIMAGGVGGWLGTLVLRRLRGSLKVVIDQAQAISQRRFVMIREPSVPELRQLAGAMNAMVGRLESMFQEEAARLEEMRRQANCDPLTGLAHRTHFKARLHQFIVGDESSGGALVLVRLGDLAAVNVRLGRDATDEMLRRVAECLQRYAQRTERGYAARLNGADFALVLPGEEDGAAMARSLLKDLIEVAAPYIETETLVWIGVGQFRHGCTVGALLAQVDDALVASQASGRSSVRAAQAGNDHLPRTSEQWSVMLRQALDQGWTRLAHFPVADFRGGLLHHEGPLRLMLDAKGMWLPAGRFLPMAERLGLTAGIDLETAALGLQALDADADGGGLAINLSGSSIADPEFRSRLLKLLGSRPDLTARLWLEIPEAGALRHIEPFKALCRQLKALDCRVGVEHFGFHFGQIGILHQLGMDYLKIDASFIHGIEASSGNQAFLKGLCGISHNLGLQVIAEGVTTDEELQAVKSIGFDAATGPAIGAGYLA